jgi:hypothetical protein
MIGRGRGRGKGEMRIDKLMRGRKGIGMDGGRKDKTGD